MKRLFLLTFSVAALFLFISLVQGCAVNPVTGKKELSLVSVTEEEEISLGKNAFVPTVSSMGGFYRDKGLNLYVQSVGDRLAKGSHRPSLPYKFRVLNSSVPNAFALPGGFIVINRGLLVALSSEAELAAVLGHEIGHVTARHAVAAYQRALAANLALLGVSVASEGSSSAIRFSSVAANLVENGYSRDQERESDYLGVDYMVRTGYDPRGAIDLQTYFYDEFEKGKRSNFFGGIFRTHPFSKERLGNIRAYIGENYKGVSGSPGYRLFEGRFASKTGRIRQVQKAYDVFDEGVKLLEKKKKKEALPKFLKAIEIEPGEAPFYAYGGLVFLLDDKLNTAINYLSKSVERDPDYADARIYLGISLGKKGDCHSALSHLEKSMDIMPTKVAAKYLGICYRKLGDLENARKYERMAR